MRTSDDNARDELAGNQTPEYPAGSLQAIGERLSRPKTEAEAVGTTEVVLPDGRTVTIGSYLREYGRQLPDSIRARLAQAYLPEVLADSVLGGLIQAVDFYLPEPDQKARPWELPAQTEVVLWAALVMQSIGASANGIQKLRDDLSKVYEEVTAWLDPTGVDPVIEAYRVLDADLAAQENLLRDIESLLEKAGYRWNSDTGRVETKTGGRPKTVLRDVVRSFLLRSSATQNTLKLREKMASELAPFFSADLLDPSKGSPLYNAVDNALRGH